MSNGQALHFNFVPADPRFLKAAIDFAVDHRGYGDAQLNGDAIDALAFLECFQHGDLSEWPEFLTYCQREGLPVVFEKRGRA